MTQGIPASIQAVLDRAGLSSNHLIGKGGEGFVFDRSKNTVLKVYSQTTKKYLEQLVVIQQRVLAAQLPYETPQILSIEESDGAFYTVERRLLGKPLDMIFPKLSKNQQRQVLGNYIKAIEALKIIKVGDLPFGQLVTTADSIQGSSWNEYLEKKLDQQLTKSQTFLITDVARFGDKIQLLKAKAAQLLGQLIEKHFVHTDYYLNNVLVNENLEISSVLDISAHAAVGDHRLDIASVCFLPLDAHVTQDHLEYATNLVVQNHGKAILSYLDLYAIFYAFYYSGLHDSDPHSYQWCLGILNDESRWNRLDIR